MSCPVFVIANQKGGVGKTTTAINLAAGLALSGHETLLIDIDSQANATSGLGLEKKEGGSLYGPLVEGTDAVDKILSTGRENFWIVPSERDIAAAEVELSSQENYLLALRRVVGELQQARPFGAIVIDCPPSAGLLSLNGLAAADYLILTLQCEYLAMEGLGEILGNLENIRDGGINPRLELGGILLTMFDIRTNLSQQVIADVRSHFGDKVFQSMIPRSIRLGEAPSFGQTIFEYEKLSSGAEAYRRFTDEVIGRFGLTP